MNTLPSALWATPQAAVIDFPTTLWNLSPLGALVGVIVIFYWLLATGRLISKTSHEREMAQAEKRGDEWKETAHDQRAVNAVVREQNSQLIESNKVLESFLRAASPGNLADTGGGRDVPQTPASV